MILKALADNQFGGRKWEWRPACGFWSGQLWFGTEMYLTQFGEKSYSKEDQQILDWYHLGLLLNPLRWRPFQYEYDYYDGPLQSITVGFMRFSWRYPILRKSHE